ncbi:hypothetical protein [Streptomyces antimicrobicus]|uniref:Uncharacterized protein n=1 Tax=Streptomyces antimicrobicus TaxID=2883108 RepID=A0ABS8B7D5_9ACTN|nr:hypothetical protein [Streptomyces antimicrobicus]MCB5180459.1 hypothetical protein [Streptomyces antimicrobicus]
MRTTLRTTTSTLAAAVALAGLVTAAGPAGAAVPAATPACSPGLVTLPSLPDPGGWTYGSVRALGSGDLAVGTSVGRPAYWTGGEVHAVPLPDGFRAGEVTAVNAKGLLVGTARRTSDQATAVFAYQLGAPVARLLTEASATGTGAPYVNDAGRVVALDRGAVKEWVNGTEVARAFPLPADARPGTEIVSLSGVNRRGDVLGTAYSTYVDPETDELHRSRYPVVWPAGGYPPYSLPVWTDDDRTVGTVATGIDNRGRVVGYEKESYRDVQRRTPAVWKQPYDAPPADPGRLAGEEQAALEAISPNTNVAVGTASTFVDGYENYAQALYWPGSGPLLALPRPGTDWRSWAHAVSDDDRVGGEMVDNSTLKVTAVIWTCASKQAFLPGGPSKGSTG